MNTLALGADTALRIGGELDDDGTLAGPLEPLAPPPEPAEPAPARQSGAKPLPATPLVVAPASSDIPAPAPRAVTVSAGHVRQLKACRAAAQTIVMGMFEHLRREAEKRDNLLTIDDLDEMREEFGARTQALEAALRRSFEDYLRERAREQRTDSREYPFDRIIVHQFAHLFVRRGDGRLAPGAVSRRVLPGFFIAIEKMLGETTLETYQDTSRRIVARYADQLDADGDWAPVYGDPVTRTLVLDALVTMGGHFEDFEKRCAWLLAIINGHLAPGEAVLNEGEAATEWELSRAGCGEIVAALFQPLCEALADQGRRKGLTERHGRPVIKEMSSLAEKVVAAGGLPATPAPAKPRKKASTRNQ